MAEAEDHASKSEQASEQKLRKAREKGDVPISREVGQMLGFGTMLVLAALAGGAVLLAPMHSLGSLFATAGQIQVGSELPGVRDVWAGVMGALGPALLLTAGALGLLFLGAMLTGLLQGPFVVSAERVRPKLDRLSPVAGLKRILSADHLLDFAKNLFKLAVIAAVGEAVVWSIVVALLPGTLVEPEWLPGLLQDGAVRMLGRIALLMVPLAILDLVWKRIRHLRRQRMSLQEVRDEVKDAEGDPHVAAKRAQIRRQRSRQRLLQAVPTATMVVTNPTHFSVALRYQRGVDAAPVCVAKGTDRIAARIRKIAHESAIPVIESPALARALYATAELEKPIPEAHWQAVARLVTYVLDLRRRIRRMPPEGARLCRPEDEADAVS
ncbi:flagellar biosynthesis protein FlhB [Tabrizicola sp.]|uniref:EscU/YscU/HrcU family type III secretion system export apparatus switch protein n=1 Tax=Tabrizicola sp. TaxID=2005166 RepID=UPI0035B1F271